MKIKKAIKKLFREIQKTEPYTVSSVKINDMVFLDGSFWIQNGICYEIRGWFDTRPYSKKPGWNCFYARSIRNPKKLTPKKVSKALHKYIKKDYEI